MPVDLVADQFLIQRRVGEGSAGAVFDAILIKKTNYANEGERVALKRYKPWVLEEHGEARRIGKELLAQVNSPHLVRAHDLVRDDGHLYLVMEFLDGMPLRDWIELNPTRTFEQLIQILTQIVGGLHDLHEAGFIHRDVKPENIMMTPRGAVVTDFGVLKSLFEESDTPTDRFLGTLRYAAPEYAWSEPYDQEIDTYGVGTVLWELIHGIRFMNDVGKMGDLWVRKYEMKVRKDNVLWAPRIVEPKEISLTPRQQVFLGTLLCGLLAPRDLRFTLHQVHQALSVKTWNRPFLTWDCIRDDPERHAWPIVPPDIMHKYEDLSNQLDEAKKCAISIHLCWYGYDGKFRSSPSPTGVSERELEKLGLGYVEDEILPHLIDDYPDGVFFLKPFAYQFLSCQGP